MKAECRNRFYYAIPLSLLLTALFFLGGCTNSEKAKAEHVRKGEAYLKDSKFLEASLEFRNALQIDDRLAAAHWGLAQANEKLEHFRRRTQCCDLCVRRAGKCGERDQSKRAGARHRRGAVCVHLLPRLIKECQQQPGFHGQTIGTGGREL